MTAATITTAEQLATALNAYTGDNEWQDVIYPSGLLDATATEAADPGYGNDLVVTTSGDVVRWDAASDAWIVGQSA